MNFQQTTEQVMMEFRVCWVTFCGSSIPFTLRISGSPVYQNAFWLCQARRWPGVCLQMLWEPTYLSLAQVQLFNLGRIEWQSQCSLFQDRQNYHCDQPKQEAKQQTKHPYLQRSYFPYTQPELIFKASIISETWCIAVFILYLISFCGSQVSQNLGELCVDIEKYQKKSFFRVSDKNENISWA